MILIITMSNKPDYLEQAVASVKAQTRTDYKHVIILDDGQPWPNVYMPARVYNQEAKKASPRDYICWLSDDDVWYPDYLATLGAALDAHPEWGCVYGASHHMAIFPNGVQKSLRIFEAKKQYDLKREPSCQIDGGQIMVRKSILDKIGYPYVPEEPDGAHTSDGALMNRITHVCPIMPVDRVVMINRTTPLSANYASSEHGLGHNLSWHKRIVRD